LAIPPTTLDNLHLIDTLDRGLAYVDCVGISAGPGITTDIPGGFSFICDNPVVSAYPAVGDDEDDGRRVDFDFGNLVKSGPGTSQLTVTYRVAVLDSLENQSGSTPLLTNQADWIWDAGNFSESEPGVDILEPDLSLTKVASPTRVYLNQTITFTLTVEHTASSGTPAFDLVLTDIIPSQLNYVTGSLRHISGQSPDLPLDDTGPTLTVTWATFDDSDNSVIAFDVVFDPSFRRRNQRQTISNNASLSWTSLPGDISGPQSGFNTLSTERFYDPLSNVNIYIASDSAVIVIPKLPGTGFAPGRETTLPKQEEHQLYSDMNDLQLEIPSLGLSLPIVSIPQTDQGWDLTWLWNQAGWLEGTAYPSWVGNTVITGHAYLSTGLPGPFADLESLSWGDEIFLYANGLKYTYQVRQRELVSADDHSILEHKEDDWLTLFTCKDYDDSRGEYLWRQVIQAVLIDVE
jgi:LPXTG-site transpeptidase (sortase) family protein